MVVHQRLKLLQQFQENLQTHCCYSYIPFHNTFFLFFFFLFSFFYLFFLFSLFSSFFLFFLFLKFFFIPLIFLFIIFSSLLHYRRSWTTVWVIEHGWIGQSVALLSATSSQPSTQNYLQLPPTPKHLRLIKLPSPQVHPLTGHKMVFIDSS